jgi:type IV pilus assembly protein PilB
MRIGELLVHNGIITQHQLDEALEHQSKEKKRVGEILIELGYLSSKDLIWMISEQADIPFIEVKPEILDSQLINTFPENILYKHNILPLYETEDKIYIAMGDPTDTEAIQEVKKHTTKEVVTSGTDPQKIEQLLNKFFLAQQAEETIDREPGGKITIRIIAEKATIEQTDESGNVTKRISPVEITINLSKKAKEENK